MIIGSLVLVLCDFNSRNSEHLCSGTGPGTQETPKWMNHKHHTQCSFYLLVETRCEHQIEDEFKSLNRIRTNNVHGKIDRKKIKCDWGGQWEILKNVALGWSSGDIWREHFTLIIDKKKKKMRHRRACLESDEKTDGARK